VPVEKYFFRNLDLLNNPTQMLELSAGRKKGEVREEGNREREGDMGHIRTENRRKDMVER
jgi:hypothetical protein